MPVACSVFQLRQCCHCSVASPILYSHALEVDDHKEVDFDDNVRCSTSSHLTQVSACGSLIAGCQETDRCSEECNYSGGGRHAYREGVEMYSLGLCPKKVTLHPQSLAMDVLDPS